MKHLEVGIVFGAIMLTALLAVSAAWAALNWLVGPLWATGSLLLLAFIVTMLVIIDWKTEKRS